MKRIFGLIASTLTMLTLASCATAVPEVPLQRLVDGTTPTAFGTGCFAAFRYGDQLAILTDYPDSGAGRHWTLYNPANGLYLYSLMGGYRGDCAGADLAAALQAKGQQFFTLNLLTNSTLRRAFDQSLANPTELARVIKAAPPYFVRGAEWQSAEIALELHKVIKASGSTLPSVALASVSDTELGSLVADRRQTDEAITRQTRAAVRTLEVANNVWRDRMMTTYQVGDKVCTYQNNFFGHIEEITADRFKVWVIGRYNGVDGQFFMGMDFRFKFEKIEAVRWFQKGELAHCSFIA